MIQKTKIYTYAACGCFPLSASFVESYHLPQLCSGGNQAALFQLMLHLYSLLGSLKSEGNNI